MLMNQEELKVFLLKVGKGALIAASGAAALYVLDAVGKIDVGVFTPLIAAIVPILVNAVREWIKGESLAGKRIAGAIKP